MVAVELLLHFPVFALAPLLLCALLADEAVFDVSSEAEAVFAEGDVFAVYALVDGFVGAYFPELATVAVVVVLLSDLFVDELLFDHVLLLFDLADDIWCLLVAAQRAFHHSVVLDLVLGPLAETLQVERVPAYSRA